MAHLKSRYKILSTLMLAGTIFAMQGCAVAPAPIPVDVTYVPHPMDNIIVDLPPQNFVYHDGWTYIRHQDTYGHWLEERYHEGDYRNELIHRRQMLYDMRYHHVNPYYRP